MKREEILEATKDQKIKDGEYEVKVQRIGSILGTAFALLAAITMIFVEYNFFHKLDYGKPALIMLIASISDLYEGIKLKRKLVIIKGIICAILLVLCVVVYIGALVKWIRKEI